MPSAVTLPRSSPAVLGDILPASLLRDALLVVGAAGVVGVLAQISFHLSFTPVPITGQTLGVLLCGTALGWKRGAAAMTLYGVAGLAGVPWFAGHTSGYVGASFGYILGFVACAALCGYLAERGRDRSLLGAIAIMVAGEIVIYSFGATWLAASLNIGARRAFALGVAPFLIGDCAKMAIAALVVPSAWRLTATGQDRQRTGQNRSS